jgi:hypothetical protein
MSDINWRDIKKDHSIFEPSNKNRVILVETDVTTRIDWAKHVEYNRGDYELRTTQEKVLRYAFID